MNKVQLDSAAYFPVPASQKAILKPSKSGLSGPSPQPGINSQTLPSAEINYLNIKKNTDFSFQDAFLLKHA